MQERVKELSSSATEAKAAVAVAKDAAATAEEKRSKAEMDAGALTQKVKDLQAEIEKLVCCTSLSFLIPSLSRLRHITLTKAITAA